MDKSINNVIDLLNVEIEILNDKETFLNDSYMYIDIYRQLFSYLDINNFSEIKDNNIYISILLEILYKKKKANKLSGDIFVLCLNITNFEKIEFYEEDISYISYFKQFKKIINGLKEEYELLLAKQELLLKDKEKRNKLYEYYNRILFCLKNNININKKDLDVIKKLLKENNYSDLDIKIILENINLYNSQINKEDTTVINRTIDILQKEYIEYKVNEFIVFDKKDKLNNYVNTIFNEINNGNNIENIAFILHNLNYEDITYVLLSVMNRYIRLLNNCKNNLIDDEIYYDSDLKDVILLEYHDYEGKYNIIKQYYDKYISEYYKKAEVIQEVKNEENELYFALTSRGPYLEVDIKDISYHYYDIIKKVLEDFKTKRLSDIHYEKFTSNNDKFKNYRKIKYDNIRIIYKKIEGNKYLILGILDKQETWARKDYDRIISRDRIGIYNEDIETNNQYYNNIIRILIKKGRKVK